MSILCWIGIHHRSDGEENDEGEHIITCSVCGKRWIMLYDVSAICPSGPRFVELEEEV